MKCSHPGCYKRANSKGYCPQHRPQPVKGERSVKEKKVYKWKVKPSVIVESNKYYFAAIEANRKANNGVCVCEECGEPIYYPKGRNVSHIVGKGNNETLYFNPENHCILCNNCEKWWTSGRGKLTRKDMKIWPKCEEIYQRLTLKYYQGE